MDKNRILTDMAVEFYKHDSISDDGVVKFYEVEVDKTLSRKLKKPCGKYATVETSVVVDGAESEYDRVAKALSLCIKSYCGDAKKVLVAGLGNPDLTADALGDRVFKRLKITRHLNPKKYIAALAPNVLGMTGIESFDIVCAVADRIAPDVVIVVDALTAAATERIASAFQVTDSGITPGSGVENHRARLDYHSLGVPVVSVGVPLVVYASTIASEYCESGGACARHDMIVTPKDVDILVDDCADIIAAAINSAF